MAKFGKMFMLAWYVNYSSSMVAARLGYIADLKLVDAEILPEVVDPKTGKVLRAERVLRPAEMGYLIEWLPGGRFTPPIGNSLTNGKAWVLESELVKYQTTQQLEIKHTNRAQ